MTLAREVEVEMAPKQIYLIRHGETEGTVDGRFSGRTDHPLTPRGMDQVARLAESLPVRLFDPGAEVWCVASPLLRTRQTAEAVAARRGLTVVTDDDLREMDFGLWEGLTSEEIEARYPGELEVWASPAGGTGFPGGESLEEFDRRVARARERILAQAAEAALVFAHGGVIRGLISGLLGLGRQGFWLFDISPASVTRVDVYDDKMATLSALWPLRDGEES